MVAFIGTSSERPPGRHKSPEEIDALAQGRGRARTPKNGLVDARAASDAVSLAVRGPSRRAGVALLVLERKSAWRFCSKDKMT
jgi:hypothetical protein